MNKPANISIVVALIVVVGSILGFYWFVKDIEGDFDGRHQPRVKIAVQQTPLEKVENVYSFVSDLQYTVITGRDRQLQKMVVWVARGFIKYEYLDDGIMATQARQMFSASNPDAEVLRTTLGLYQQNPAWEVYYENRSNKENARKGYAYYRFYDGAEMANIQLRGD